MPTLLRGVSFLALAASVATLVACAADKPTTADANANWNFPGETQTASTKPLMRLVTYPMNPAPPAPYEYYTDEPTRFIFRPRLVIIDEETGVAQEADTGAAGDVAPDAGGE